VKTPSAVADQPAELRVAVELEGHVLDEMRQLVAGVAALEFRRAIDVIARIDEPMHVKHNDGVDAELTAAPPDLDVPIDGGLPAAVVLARELRQVKGGDMGHLGSERELSHGSSPSGRSG